MNKYIGIIDRFVSMYNLMKLIILSMLVVIVILGAIALRNPIIMKVNMYPDKDKVDTGEYINTVASNKLTIESLNVYLNKMIEYIQLDNAKTYDVDLMQAINASEGEANKKIKELASSSGKNTTQHDYYSSAIAISGKNEIKSKSKDTIVGEVTYKKYLFYEDGEVKQVLYKFKYEVKTLNKNLEKLMMYKLIMRARDNNNQVSMPFGIAYGLILNNYEIQEVK